MTEMLKEALRDAFCTGKQLAFLLLLAAGIALAVSGPIWGIFWLLGGIK